MEGREDQILYFKCGVRYVHKSIFYRVRSILTSQGQTVWSRKNGRHFRTKPGKSCLHAYFARNNYSNLNPNICLTLTLTFDRDLGFFHVLLLLDDANTLVSDFFLQIAPKLKIL